jgi:histidyl-tRNA synthetase
VAPLGKEAVGYGLLLAQALRSAGISAEVDGRGASLKAQLRRASAVGARFALIAGDAEVSSQSVQLKDLAAQSQESVARGDLVSTLRQKLGAAS